MLSTLDCMDHGLVLDHACVPKIPQGQRLVGALKPHHHYSRPEQLLIKRIHWLLQFIDLLCPVISHKEIEQPSHHRLDPNQLIEQQFLI